MKKIKGYWFQFWHCLWFTLKLKGDHREMVMYDKDDKILWIGCACGKCYYCQEK